MVQYGTTASQEQQFYPGGLLQRRIVGDCKQWQVKCMQCKVRCVPWPAAEVSIISPVPESVSCHTIPSRLTLVPGSHGPSCSGSVTVLASVTVPASTCNKKYFKYTEKYFLQIPQQSEIHGRTLVDVTTVFYSVNVSCISAPIRVK